ncbi:hypothetical protein A8975_1821 [Meridianimaribacter flavus]|uniref:Uncharacterized protein n=1 Tax=Meridianimaribacter flavus TaxID=571115 RepID=A0ABY2G656_9FLAO|nr:hypothetical protein A8975_1821 [Meridianimaribacter flavus]
MKQDNYKWQKMYTLILVANALYILFFYLITQAY